MSVSRLIAMLACTALVGCGGGGGGDDVDSGLTIIDGSMRDTGTTADSSTITPDSGTPAACNVVANTGCSGATPKCGLIQPTGQALQIGCGTGGTGTQGMNCQATTMGDNCAGGFLCITAAVGAQPTCLKVCGTTAPSGTCDTGTDCSFGVTGVDALLCGPVTSCDPLAQTGCSGTDSCYIAANASGQPVSRCLPTGTAAAGATCTGQANSCARGSSCLTQAAGGSKCFFHCNTASGGSPMCAATGTGGATCAADARISATFGFCQ